MVPQPTTVELQAPLLQLVAALHPVLGQYLGKFGRGDAKARVDDVLVVGLFYVLDGGLAQVQPGRQVRSAFVRVDEEAAGCRNTRFGGSGAAYALGVVTALDGKDPPGAPNLASSAAREPAPPPPAASTSVSMI